MSDEREVEDVFPVGSVECCCGRQIVENEAGDWDHVDGEGMFCWPGARPGTSDAEYTAEPATKHCEHAIRMFQADRNTYRCTSPGCGHVADRDWSAVPGRTG